ncbi:MAG: 5-formyltetrahydrofolate cyclo-ligase [Chlorobium sp.]|uniref:5-formyltetrahydrofolate cyclo-ligase n=1 Tax=Chlorobium sp. TaxID=1095 RepID=UPI0025B7E2BD|nr:5-formyltetrahydrofolate cyclo-ligase [Chlorobium sp.]MCF8382444.1 5-formyltetrahydrofolate cyclo-ligase [Chlorobium sp.]
MSSPSESKQVVRKEVLAIRKRLQHEEWLEKSEEIAARVFGIPEVSAAEHLLVYLSIAETREVSTGKIIKELCGSGRKLSVPVIRQERLVPCGYMPGEKLDRGMFGQPEPALFRSVDPSGIDAVIIPLVAADEDGYRMGYGRGYFDRFLSELAAAGHFPCRVGLAFRLQIVPLLPLDPWDERLDYIVHECGVMRFT